MTLQNSPPDIAFSLAIDDLYEEARSITDGKPIQTEGEAELFSTIFDTIKQLIKDADNARKAEKQPFDDGAKAVQAKWKPIIDKAELAKIALGKPLTVYREAKLEEQRLIAEQARMEADRLRQEALDAKGDDGLEGLEQLEAKRAIADKAEKDARRAVPKGATGLRTSWVGEVTDYSKALGWLRGNHPERLRMAIDEMIREAVNSGAREIDGVAVTERKKAA